jgi:lipopolysaccharide biosynthesis glycosyltransferase
MTKKSLDILYQCDDAYSLLCGVSLESLLENNKDMNLFIHIMNDGMTSANKKRVKEIAEKHKQSLEFIDAKPIVNELKALGVAPYRGESYAPYFKIFAYRDVKTKTGKLLYIDCDILILNSVADLSSLELENHSLGMVEDFIGGWYKQVIKLPQTDTYYNAGLMLVDQENWKKNNFTEEILKSYQETGKNYWLADQDIINICCGKDTKKLDIKYNLFSQFYDGVSFTKFIYGTRKDYYSTSHIRKTLANPTTVHCMSGWYGRPWMTPNNHPVKQAWREHLSNTPFNTLLNVSNPNANYDIDRKLSKLPLLHKILIAIVRFKKIKKVIRAYS